MMAEERIREAEERRRIREANRPPGRRHLRRSASALFLPLLLLLRIAAAQAAVPEIVVDRDDVAITKSCRIKTPMRIADVNGDGIIHVKASGVTITFVGDAPLRGKGAPAPDGLTGTGIRIDGHKNVTLHGARIRDLKVAIHATKADGLVVDGADCADLFRHHLKSTPEAEDGADWLWPHENDGHEWRTSYGAAICIEDSSGVTVRTSVGRRGQNGIILDRVDGAQVYDNDFSFLSGWGLAMWRTNRCVVARNAFDFCIRGYSHGVYNRGQDSAGILMFEQCSNNLVVANSITHGGDGVFGFAGKEALGEKPPAGKGFDYERKGCNDNRFEGNDLSYAAAHGLEMTFSFGNQIVRNRIAGNAICGIWGGYSQNTLIGSNHFSGNGDAGYGLERGGVNIEHGFQNRIIANEFNSSTCGVHLWFADNKEFPKSPWGRANYRGCLDNVVAFNRMISCALGIHLRSAKNTIMHANVIEHGARDVDVDAASSVSAPVTPIDERSATGDALPASPGTKQPVGARVALEGRDKIIMTEWGPWDHGSPLVRRVASRGFDHVYALHAMKNPVTAAPKGDVAASIDSTKAPPELRVTAKKPGITTYTVTLDDPPAAPHVLTGTIIATKWSVRFFKTSKKPHENPEAWKADMAGEDAVTIETDHLDFPFGGAGPKGLPSNQFGLVAETKMPFPRGKWRLTTLSDDGVRVFADGKRVIDAWTWHVPQKDVAILDVTEARTIPIRVEYFELDGGAVLKLDIERAPE